MDAEYYMGLYDEPDKEEKYVTECKWCGKNITMTPDEDGKWRPMRGGQLHICEARNEADRKRMISLLPDIDD